MNASPERGSDCPSWCVERHGLVRGEDDWVHTGMVTTVPPGIAARLCVSVDPDTGEVDGPLVLLGGEEVSLDDARVLGQALIDMADATAPRAAPPPGFSGRIGRQRGTPPTRTPGSPAPPP